MRLVKIIFSLLAAAAALVAGLVGAAIVAVVGAGILVASRLLGRPTIARMTWQRGASGPTRGAPSARRNHPEAIDVTATEVRADPTLQ
jgi:hypothetical protein